MKCSRKTQLIREVLSGAWRSSEFPPLQLSEPDLDEVAPLLYDSGAAALGWRRISETSLRHSSSGEVLHQAFRLLSLQSEIHEQQIEKVFRLLRECSVDAILAKGWAAAGLYPERALRPFGDIDICVRPKQFKLAEEILASVEGRDCWVDLHRTFSEISDRSFDELFARASFVNLGEEEISTLGPEDHVALLSTHFLKHGGWRPLWLCDIAAAMESLPATFDWEVCLGSSTTKAKWIKCAVGLATLLLGARVPSSPPPPEPAELPAWLVESVLKAWAAPYARNQPPMSHPIPMRGLLLHPSGLLEGLRQRWPNPIIATVSVNGEFNNQPRLPYQMANCLYRIGRLFHSSGGLQEH